MFSPWFELPHDPEVGSIEDTLRAWFFDTSCEHLGDVACCAEFDGRVACISIPYVYSSGGTRSHYVDLKNVDPFLCSWFLFYTYSSNDELITLWGGLPYDQVVAQRGVVDTWKLSRTRAFFPREEEGEQVAEEEPIPLFDVPSIPFTGTMNLADVFTEAERVWHKLVGKQQPITEISNEALLGLGMICDYLPLHLPPYEKMWNPTQNYMRFRHDYMEVVKRHYDETMDRHFKTEDAILVLLKCNFPADIIVAPTRQLNQHYLRRFPSAQRAPAYYVSVSSTELPESILNQVPLGKNCIITAWDVREWIWFRFEQQQQRQHAWMSHVGHKDDRLRAMFIPIVKNVVRYYVEHPTTRVYSAVPTKLSMDEIDPNAGFVLTDMEDLWNSFPPCMAALKTNQRFPRNMERVRAVQILQSAGVSLKTTEDWLVGMNERYPKPEHPTAIHRFDHTAVWKNNLGTCHCGNIINDTYNNRPDTLRCPYVPKDVKPHPELKHSCMSQCVGGGVINFTGPHNLIRRRLYQLKK